MHPTDTCDAVVLLVCLPDFAADTRGLAAAGLIALTREYRKRFMPLLEDAGGSIAETVADAILVTFGLAAQTGREAADAVGAAGRVLAAAEAWARARAAQGLPTPRLRVTAACGAVSQSVLGYGEGLTLHLEGEPVAAVKALARRPGEAAAIVTDPLLARARRQGWRGTTPLPAEPLAIAA